MVGFQMSLLLLGQSIFVSLATPCSIWDLSSPARIKPMSPAVEITVLTLDHWEALKTKTFLIEDCDRHFWIVTHKCDQPHGDILFLELISITQPFISVFYFPFSHLFLFYLDWQLTLDHISGLVSFKIPLTFILTLLGLCSYSSFMLNLLFHAANCISHLPLKIPYSLLFLSFQPSNCRNIKYYMICYNTCKIKAKHRTNLLICLIFSFQL